MNTNVYHIETAEAEIDESIERRSERRRKNATSGKRKGAHNMAKNGRISQSEIETIAIKAFEQGVRYDREANYGEKVENEAIAAAVAIVREELEKAGVRTQQRRRATAIGSSLEVIRSYLPANYSARIIEGTDSQERILIEGFDRAGWTLDDYVIPRLASGLIVAREVS